MKSQSDLDISAYLRTKATAFRARANKLDAAADALDEAGEVLDNPSEPARRMGGKAFTVDGLIAYLKEKTRGRADYLSTYFGVSKDAVRDFVKAHPKDFVVKERGWIELPVPSDPHHPLFPPTSEPRKEGEAA
jgi:hypothetical protein